MWGGTVCDYLWKKYWQNEKDWDCLKILKENGMNWVRVGVLVKETPELNRIPKENWGRLCRDAWNSLEYAEAILNWY